MSRNQNDRYFAKKHSFQQFCEIILIFIFSSNMTNSKPIAGFLVVLEPATLSSRIPFFFGQNFIGRSESKATIVIKEPSISQKHAKLVATANKITIMDLGSKNGTKLTNEDNYIQTENQVQIYESMIIYFADAKCRIQILDHKQQSMKLQSPTIKVQNKKKQNPTQKAEKIEKESKIQQKKVEKNEFKRPQYPSDFDLEEKFQGNVKIEQKQTKITKEESKKNKKNTKSKPQLNKKNIEPEKNNKNTQQQQKEQNSLSKHKTEQQKVSLKIKNSPKKESKEKEKRKSPQIVQKNVRFQRQIKQEKQKKNKEPQNKQVKIQENQKEQSKKYTSKEPKSKKQQKDNVAKKKEDLNQSLHQKLDKKKKYPQQTSLEQGSIGSIDTIKKKIKSRKKLPSESLQRELRDSARRSIVGKRVLFSGFVPKMRRKYFVLVQDYNESFDYLVMKQYTRTFKALIAIAQGILIVKYAWIQESQQCLRTLNVNNYRFSKLQAIYQAIERAKSGQKIFKGYQFYLLSEQYHLKAQQIQTLIRIGGGQTKTIKGQVKIKDPRKSIAILRNKQQNSVSSELKSEIGKAKKYGFELIYCIEFLLDACEKQQINWQNSKL